LITIQTTSAFLRNPLKALNIYRVTLRQFILKY
jgi:hypothetical protein